MEAMRRSADLASALATLTAASRSGVQKFLRTGFCGWKCCRKVRVSSRRAFVFLDASLSHSASLMSSMSAEAMRR